MLGILEIIIIKVSKKNRKLKTYVLPNNSVVYLHNIDF